MTVCNRCNGTGSVPSIEVGSKREPVRCIRCEGTGRIYGQAVNPNEMMSFKRQYGQICKCRTCYGVFAVRNNEQMILGAGSGMRTPHSHDLYEIMTGRMRPVT